LFPLRTLNYETPNFGIIPIFRGFLEQLKHKIPLLSNGILCFDMLDFSYYG